MKQEFRLREGFILHSFVLGKHWLRFLFISKPDKSLVMGEYRVIFFERLKFRVLKAYNLIQRFCTILTNVWKLAKCFYRPIFFFISASIISYLNFSSSQLCTLFTEFCQHIFKFVSVLLGYLFICLFVFRKWSFEN